MQSILHKQFTEFVAAPPPTRPKKLLDIDSTHRNRKLYPYPSTFEIPLTFGPSGNAVLNSQDPVSLAWPIVENQLYGALGGPSVTVTLNANSSINNFTYNNYYLEHESTTTTPTYVRILDYNGTTKIATLESAVTVGAGDRYSIRAEIPTVRGQLSGVTSTLSVTVPAALINSHVVNMWFRMVDGAAAGSYGLIQAVNTTTGVITLKTGLSALPAIGDIFEICAFSYNNYSPLLYYGTTTNNQPVCHNLLFVGIVIPNTEILNGYRSRPQNYPYFYVRIYNSNPRTGGSNIYSNNPGSELACFKVLPYTSRTDISFLTYVVPEIQTISLRIDESLFFELTLPNGEPVIWLEADNMSPAPPNPFLQISATFQLERLAP